jgi:hypothetical protein
MAGSPQWKVYDPDGVYVACFKHVEDAAAFVAIRGPGTTIRKQHGKPLWTEGSEEFSAGESYDRVFDVVMQRAHEQGRESYFRIYGRYPA